MLPSAMVGRGRNRVGNPTPEFFSSYQISLVEISIVFLTRARPPPGLHLASWAWAVLPPVDQTISGAKQAVC